MAAFVISGAAAAGTTRRPLPDEPNHCSRLVAPAIIHPMILVEFLRAHWLEVLGFATGVSCVLLGIAEIAWSWPVGIAYNIVLFVVFWSHGVYALALLQVLYVGIAIYGWWNWLHGGAGHGALNISRTPFQLLAFLGMGSAATVLLFHWLLGRYTDSTVPWLDAVTTALALAAQYLLSRKMMATWFVFSVVDVIAIVINLEKKLYPLIALYCFFLGLCVFGFFQWRRHLLAAESSGAQDPQ